MEKIIVSMTSYPARIRYVDRVIKTILIQTQKPDKVILWLSEEEFPNKDRDLPEDLVKLIDFGLDIRWCEDLKPHKKYFFVMQEYPDDIIITVDDDVYYSPRLVEELMKEYELNRKSVICARANRIIRPKDRRSYYYSEFLHIYKDACKIPAADLLPTGIGGVLYPPHSIPTKAFNIEWIRDTCFFQDDIWLKAWSLVNGYTSLVIEKDLPLDSIGELQQNCLYNNNKTGGNDQAFISISDLLDREYYPGIFYEKLFESDNSLERKYGGMFSAEKNLYETFKSKFSDGEIYIYGAGKGAHMVKDLLYSSAGIKPDGYIVTESGNNPEKIDGIEVFEANKITPPDKNYRVIISPAEIHHSEIKNTLKKAGWKNFIFIKDIWMGEIIRCNNRIKDVEKYIIEDFLKTDFLNSPGENGQVSICS